MALINSVSCALFKGLLLIPKGVVSYLIFVMYLMELISVSSAKGATWLILKGNVLELASRLKTVNSIYCIFKKKMLLMRNNQRSFQTMKFKNWIRLLRHLTLIHRNLNNLLLTLLIKTQRNARVATNVTRFSMQIIYQCSSVFNCMMRA